MKTSLIAHVVVLSAVSIAAGCGKNPTGPDVSTEFSTTNTPGFSLNLSSPTSPSSSCRNYASATTGVSSGAGYTMNSSTSCTFSASTSQLKCSYKTSDNNGASSMSTGIVTYASVSDFVAEVKVIPPLRRSLRVTTSDTAGGPTAVTLVNTYDSQNRLTRDVQTSTSGTVTSTNTSWDRAGRPTAGTISYPGGLTATVVWSHNDSTRTTTMTSTLAGQQVVTTMAFDANGNPTSVSSSGIVAKTTTTATQTVCR